MPIAELSPILAGSAGAGGSGESRWSVC